MRILLKFIFLILITLGFYSCENRPVKKIEVITRIANPNEMDFAIKSLLKRSTKFAVEASAVKLDSTDILLEITTKEEVELIKQNLLSSVNLEFYETVPAGWVTRGIANRFVEGDGSYPGVLNKIVPNNNNDSPIIWSAAAKDTLDLMNFLKSFPALEGHEISSNMLKLKWGIADDKGKHPLYVLKTTNSGAPEMDGDIIESAMHNYDALGRDAISLTMTPAAAEHWGKFTGRAAKERFQIAIVLDGIVYSAPGVTSPITGGRSQISADYIQEEAQQIATALNLGYLPKMQLISFKEIKE